LGVFQYPVFSEKVFDVDIPGVFRVGFNRADEDMQRGRLGVIPVTFADQTFRVGFGFPLAIWDVVGIWDGRFTFG
jgi:hypothetical protein